MRGYLNFRKNGDSIDIIIKTGFKDSFNLGKALTKKKEEIINSLLGVERQHQGNVQEHQPEASKELYPSNDSQPSINTENPPNIADNPISAGSHKTKLAVSLITFFGGGLGLHKFYTGSWGWGLVYLASCFIIPGVSALVSLVEFIRVLTLAPEKFNEKYNRTHPKPFSFIW